MKKLLLLIGLVASTVSGFAQASDPIILGAGTSTNNVAASATNTYALDITAPKAGYVGLVLSCKMQAATNSTVTFTFKPFDGGTNVSTVAAQALAIPVVVVTNTQETYVTNILLGGVAGWRLTSIGNTNGGAFVTNILVKAIYKDGI